LGLGVKFYPLKPLFFPLPLFIPYSLHIPTYYLIYKVEILENKLG